MAADDREVIARIPSGSGTALDLGGTMGARGPLLEERGYTYVNLDRRPGGYGKVQADANRLPFKEGVFSLVTCPEAFDSFPDLPHLLGEVRRALAPGGLFIVWAQFMNQYGAGDDIYRFTPDGLRNVLGRAGFEVEALEGPERLFGLLAEVPTIAFRKRGMNKPADGSRAVGRGLDRIFRRRRDGRGLTLSHAYIATARKTEERHAHIALPRTTRRKSGELTQRERSTIDTIPAGRGRAVEIEGNAGPEDALRALGYSVVPEATSATIDDDPLQVEDGSLSLVLASDGLGRFPDPLRAITEIRRTLADDGTFVAWMPHLHPWSGGEYLRFTPVGIAVLLRWAGFKVTHFDAPLRLMSVLGQVTIHGLRMTEGGGAARAIERVAYGADRVTKRFLGLGYAYAAGFRVVARPAPIPSDRSFMNTAGTPLSQLWTELADEQMTQAMKKAGR